MLPKNQPLPNRDRAVAQRDTELAPASMTIADLVYEANKTAKEKGWDDPPPTFAEALALLHSEVSEALEEYRNGYAPSEARTRHDGKPEGIPSEMADILIRVGHYCAIFGIDLDEALRVKLEWNKSRPHRHGGKVL